MFPSRVFFAVLHPLMACRQQKDHVTLMGGRMEKGLICYVTQIVYPGVWTKESRQFFVFIKNHAPSRIHLFFSIALRILPENLKEVNC